MNEIPVTREEDEAFAAMAKSEVQGTATTGAAPPTRADEIPRLMPSPVTRELAIEILDETFQPIRDRQLKAWIDRGSPRDTETLRDELIAAFGEMLDRGEIIRLSVEEMNAVQDEFGGEFYDILHADEHPKLKSAVGKICFAAGRMYGLTNYDMGIEEENDGACRSC